MTFYKINYFTTTHFSFYGNDLNDVISCTEKKYKKSIRNYIYALIPIILFGLLFLIFEIGMQQYEYWYQFYEAIGLSISWKDYISLSLILGAIISGILLIMNFNYYLRLRLLWLMIKNLDNKKLNNNNNYFEVVFTATTSYFRHRKYNTENVVILKINHIYISLTETSFSRKSSRSQIANYKAGTTASIYLVVTNSLDKTNYIEAYLKSNDHSIVATLNGKTLSGEGADATLSSSIFTLKDDNEKINAFYQTYLLPKLN